MNQRLFALLCILAMVFPVCHAAAEIILPVNTLSAQQMTEDETPYLGTWIFDCIADEQGNSYTLPDYTDNRVLIIPG